MKQVLVPPDGGYGWVIVSASILNNFLMVPLIQNVGLIFKDKMMEIDMTITQMLFTLNVHASFGQITGLINSLLLKRFGYRKVTLAGVTFVFLGLSLSSWVHNYVGFLVTFGLTASLGVGLNTSSYTLAIKSYFVNNQNKAIGLSMTLTALGPILMPQIINLLIQNYHPDGVILILASIIAHGYIGALLLQPVKKHMVKIEVEEETNKEEDKIEMTDDENEALDEFIPQTGPNKQFLLFPPNEYRSNRRFPGFRRKDSVISINYEQETTGIMGLDSTLGGSLYSLESVGRRKSSVVIPQIKYQTKTTWWKSEDTIHLDSSYNLFDEIPATQTKENNGEEENSDHVQMDHKKNQQDKLGRVKNDIYKDLSIKIVRPPWYKRIFYRIVHNFGLDIFADIRYVNLMIGLSMALMIELNFTVLIPFLLDEYFLTIPEIASFLSVMGAADILFRFLAPHIGDCFRFSTRIMILSTLGVIIAARTGIIFITTYPSILAVAFLLGCVKGLRVVYMSLVIPSYVPKEKLAVASAIQIISNSVLSLLGGYLLGIIRKRTGSYMYCIIFMNCVTFITIISWTCDIMHKKLKKKDCKAEECDTPQSNIGVFSSGRF